MAPPISPELRRHFAKSSTKDLITHGAWTALNVHDIHIVYAHVKQATTLRVQGYAKSVGDKGPRTNSISPAIVLTSIRQAEVKERPQLDEMLKLTGMKPYESTEDVAAAVSLLAGRGSNWITGTDFLLDGGAVAAIRFGEVPQVKGEGSKCAAMAAAA